MDNLPVTTLPWSVTGSGSTVLPLVTGLVWPALPVSGGLGHSCWLVTSAQVQQLRGALQFLCLQVRFTDIVPYVSGSSCYFPDLALPQLDSLTVLGEQVYQGVDQLGLQDFSQGPAATHPQPPYFLNS